MEEQAGFFAPTFALGFGQVHQTRPYVSPDTKEWVVANATLIPQADGEKRAFVHFEVTVESFRGEMGASKPSKRGNEYELRVIDSRSGKVVIDSGHRQRVGAALGVPRDTRFAELARGARPRSPIRWCHRAGWGTGPRIAASNRPWAMPMTGSSWRAQRRRPAACSRASARCRSRCSRSRC